MFNIGGSEMVLLAVLALLVFGPEGLPEILKTVARTVKAFKQAANDFQSEVNTALVLENQKTQVEQRRRKRVRPEGEVAQVEGNLPEGEDSLTDSSPSEADVQDREAAPQVMAGGPPAVPEEALKSPEQAAATLDAPLTENESPAAPALDGTTADPEPVPPAETSILLSGDATYSEQADGDEDGPGRPMSRSARAEAARRARESEPPAADLETVI